MGASGRVVVGGVVEEQAGKVHGHMNDSAQHGGAHAAHERRGLEGCLRSR